MFQAVCVTVSFSLGGGKRRQEQVIVGLFNVSIVSGLSVT